MRLIRVRRDFLFAFRLLRGSPGFTTVAILTLALGIGANTAIFTVVNAVLLQPLPLQSPERLVFLIASRAESRYPFSVPAYESLRDRNHSFSSVTAFCEQGLTLTGLGEPERLEAALVSASFFGTLESQPLLGRAFLPGEDQPGAKPVVLISHSLWQRRFAADRGVLGKTLTLDGNIATIIGVMPPAYGFPFRGTDVWVPGLAWYSGLQPEQVRNGAGFLNGIGRLRPGVDLRQAQSEAVAVFHDYRREHPGNPDAAAQGRMEVVPLQEQMVTELRPALWTLSVAVGLVLLIACGNVAGLLLARAAGRGKEIGLRAALGAGRSTLIRQLLSETVLLFFAGAVAGILLATWSTPAMVRAFGLDGPGALPIRVDLAALVFTIGVTLLTAIVFGLAPALQFSKPDLNALLREGSWGSTPGGGRHRSRAMLVGAQMALSLVLLIGAGLLLESFRHVQAVPIGFDSHNGLTVNLSLPPSRYAGEAQRAQFVRDLLSRVEQVPGVRSASMSLALPLEASVMAPFLVDGQAAVPMGQRPLAAWNAVTPGYFLTLGIPIRQGRDFGATDDAAAPPRVIVSESLARRFWPGQNVIGKHLRYARREIDAEVVGVAADVKTRGLEAGSDWVFYTPYPQFAWPNLSLTVRTASDPLRALHAVRAQVYAADPDLPVNRPRTLAALVGEALERRRQTMILAGGFAVLAMVLTMVGLYGVVAYSVTQRTAEIGIRQALGAQRRDILRLVLGQALRLTAAGVAVGALLALFASRLLATMLFGIGGRDPVTFVGVSLLFVVVSLIAGYVPARRATRIDPASALRL